MGARARGAVGGGTVSGGRVVVARDVEGALVRVVRVVWVGSNEVVAWWTVVAANVTAAAWVPTWAASVGGRGRPGPSIATSTKAAAAEPVAMLAEVANQRDMAPVWRLPKRA